MKNSHILNVLVVDDEEKIGEMFVKWLSLKGHSVNFVMEGKKALHLIKQKTFGLVFLDILMPGISTEEILEGIKKISPKTKVIIITGKMITHGLMEELERKGASDFLQKPFKMNDVMKIINKMDAA